MATTQEILDRLNAYDSDGEHGDIWQDVILKLDEYDEAGTERIDPSASSDRIALTDGTVIRYDPQTKSWIEQP